MNQPNLYIFTSAYPNGTSEPFLSLELLNTHHFWNKIYIVNNSNITSIQKQYLPENAIEISLIPNLSKRKVFFKFKSLIIYLHIIIFEILFSRQRIPFLKHFKKNNNILIASINQSIELQNILDTIIVEVMM